MLKVIFDASSLFNNSSVLGLSGSIFATGKNFRDALAAGPVAGHSRSFVLLVVDDNDAAVQYARKWTEDYGGRSDTQDMVPTAAYIAGGVNAVSDSTASSLSAGSVEKVGVRALAAPVSDIRNQLIS